MEATVLAALPPLMPTKAQEGEQVDREEFRRAELEAKPATTGERNVIMITAISAPTNEEVKAAVSALPARPCWASGWPSNVVATDQGSPGMLNRIEVMAPPKSAPQ